MEKSILILGTFASRWGGSRGVCEDLSERLQTRGWRVITASHQRGRIARALDIAAATIRHRKQYALAQIDLFSGAAFWWAATAAYLLRALRKPFVISLHGGSLPMFSQRHAVATRWLLNTANAVTAPSGYLANALNPYCPKIQIIPNGMDVARYPFRLRENPQPRLIWIRAFHQLYNPAMAPKVLAGLIQAHPQAQLVMIGADKGDGSLAETRRTAEQFGVSTRISFPGFVQKSQIPEWLNQADIFLNTTSIDNTPVTIMEAMACGLCVISTNAGGVPYILENESSGLTVAPDDAPAMTAAVQRILTDPDLAGRLSKNARAQSGNFDWSSLLDLWESLLTHECIR